MASGITFNHLFRCSMSQSRFSVAPECRVSGRHLRAPGSDQTFKNQIEMMIAGIRVASGRDTWEMEQRFESACFWDTLVAE